MQTIPEASRRFYRMTVAFPTLFAANEARSAIRHAIPAHAAIVSHTQSEPVKVRSRWLVSFTVDGAHASIDRAKLCDPRIARALGGAFRSIGSARADADAAHAAVMRRDGSPAARAAAARAAAAAITPTAHVLATDGEPTGAHYDRTQTDETIRDGDVLIIGRTVAILDRAWPVAIVGPCGAFHTLRDGAGDDACDADRARSGRAPLAPIIARIRAGEFTPAER
jgi:hypothetical protein